jgi:energy-converting hydrogenase Eha subunit C
LVEWLRIAQVGYFVFAVVAAIVLASRSLDDLGIAALLSIGSFVILALCGYFLFEKIIPKIKF